MPDKTTPQIEKAVAALMENYGYDRDGPMPEWVPASAERDARAVLLTTLEPSEAEIKAAARKMCCEHECEIPPNAPRDHLLGRVSICQAHSYEKSARQGLIAAARVRLGQ